MREVQLRPYEESDILPRYRLFQDRPVQENILPLNFQLTEEELLHRDRRIIADGQRQRLIFVVETNRGTPIGYIWAYPIHWRSRWTEVALAIAPQYRLGYGALALVKMVEFLFDELDLHTVVHQIYEGNTLMQQDQQIRHMATLVQRAEVWSGGRYRSSFLWSQTRAQFRWDRASLLGEVADDAAPGAPAAGERGAE